MKKYIFNRDEFTWAEEFYEINTLKNILKCLERSIFIRQIYPYEVFYRENETISYEDFFYKYSAKEITYEDIIKKIDAFIKNIISKHESHIHLISHYEKSGFYEKKITPYILWEYEKSLHKQSKNPVERISHFYTPMELYNSIEHIYPQNPTADYWKQRFNYGHYNKRFRNSLGNLLILSAPKNEKLANRPFPEKCCNKDNNIGYQFGSYSEMEVARNSDWTSKTILERGIKLLQFINQKWSLDIKKKDFKKILGFDIPLKK